MADPPDHTTPSTSSRSRKKKTRHNENDKPYPSSPPSSNLLPSSKSDLYQLIAVLTVAAFVLMICNFLTSSNQTQKHQPPFCDTSSTSTDHELYDDYFNCRPCPEYGVCYGGKLECQPGYVHHDADDGTVCVEDGHVHQVAKMLSEWVQVRVCEAYSQLLCNGIGKSWVSEGELWTDLYEYRKNDSYGGDPDEAIYMLAKQRAMETIRNSLETRRENHGVEEFKCTESVVNKYKPLTCSVRQWIIKHILLLVMACPLLVGCILISFRARKQHQLSLRAEQLYHEVCDILEEKPLSSRSSDGEYESWVVASWLRDHLLSPKERKDPSLWKKVEELVQEDSRVEQYPKLVKGESKVVWEWQVEGPLSSGKKKNHVRSPKSEGRTNSIARSIYAA